MGHLPPARAITQEEADDAAAAAARFWPEIGRRWRWTRQQSLAPVYTRVGEMTVALLRYFREIQLSNQARWYQRDVRDTPAIYVLFPDAFREEAEPLLAGGDPREIEGKQALSFIYLAPGSGGTTEVAKTLLASTETTTPYYNAQLAHELMNCFCATGWDGQTLRSGIRRANWGAGARLQQGGALNDLLIDTQLLGFLPWAGAETLDSLLGGMLGPYWEIVRAYTGRLATLPVREVLFSPDGEHIDAFEHALDTALNVSHAAAEIDRMLSRHDWQGLQTLATAL